MRTMSRLSRRVHEQLTSSSLVVHDMFMNWCASQCGRAFSLTRSRIDVTSCSRLVYTPHEQFVHGTSSSRRVHEQLMSRSQLLSDSCNRVGAAHQALYVGTTSKFSLEQRHDVTLFQRIMAAGGIYTFPGHCSPFHYMQHIYVSDFFFLCIRFIWLPEHDSKANVGYIF